MRKRLIYISIFVLFMLVASEALAKMPIPGRTKNYVNDYAGVLDKDTIDYLEKLSASIKQKTPDKVELIIATFKSVDGWWFGEFASTYGEKWRAAKRFQRDNGVIVLAIIEDNRVAIGVGDNLKDIFYQKRLQDINKNLIAPDFKQKRYAEGLKKGAEEIVAILNEADIPKNDLKALLKPIGIAVLVIGAFVIIVLPFFRKKN